MICTNHAYIIINKHARHNFCDVRMRKAKDVLIDTLDGEILKQRC